jgi:hypothetical protein
MKEVNRKVITDTNGCVVGFEVVYTIKDENTFKEIAQLFASDELNNFSSTMKENVLTIIFKLTDKLTKTISIIFDSHSEESKDQMISAKMVIIEEGQKVLPKDVRAYRKLSWRQEIKLEALAGLLYYIKDYLR